MTSTADIIDFLRSQRLLSDASAGALDGVVRGVATDSDAGEGDMAWISRRNLEREPRRWQAFNGTLLIVPDSAEIAPTPSFTVVRARDPKLSFIRAVTQFFAALRSEAWPRDHPIALGTNRESSSCRRRWTA